MRLALRTQLVLASAFLVLLCVFSIGFLVLGEVRVTLRDQMEQRGLAIARHLAGISGDFVLAKEQLALANFTSGALNNRDVLYAQIMDQGGIILAASPSSNINGLYFPPAGLTGLGAEESLAQRFYNGRQWVQDVAVKVMVGKGQAGSVHVGMDERAIDLVLEGVRNRILLAAGAVLAVGLMVSWIMALAIAKPLERLALAAKHLGQGALDTRVQVGGPYELQRLEERFNAMAAKVENLVRGVIQSLATALGEHDQVSPGHADRVARYSVRTAKQFKHTAEQLEDIKLASQLIDIGHMGVPAGLLHKSDPLSDDELRKLRMHPQVGARIIEPIPVLKNVVPLLMHHHERWDGRGYPLGLKGEAIPLGARILAVCDAFDAMLTEKRHRKARSQADAVRELSRCAGAQFDPKVVEAFIAQLTQAS
jgi:response regulator RpfG family c-di-GMP phosphodiesterase